MIMSSITRTVVQAEIRAVRGVCERMGGVSSSAKTGGKDMHLEWRGGRAEGAKTLLTVSSFL